MKDTNLLTSDNQPLLKHNVKDISYMSHSEEEDVLFSIYILQDHQQRKSKIPKGMKRSCYVTSLLISKLDYTVILQDLLIG